MRPNCCHSFLAFILKFLNFLQFFLGISTVIYSAYLLNQWHNRAPFVPSPPSPPAAPVPALPPHDLQTLYFNGRSHGVADRIHLFNLAGALVSGSEPDFANRLHSVELPAPWFIYFLMAVGILLCCMSCIGHIAAEAINGCCLCFRWEKDLPFDPTGELDKFRSFVEENSDICKWVGITLLSVQALSLLLSLVLRAMISAPRADSDIEDGYTGAGDRMREPLLNSQSNQSSGLTKGDSKGTLSEIWTTRIRQKYGLSNESKWQSQNQAASSSMKSSSQLT